MVLHSNENLAVLPPENQHQQPDEGERQRRNKLKTHRRYRTQTRNLLKTDLQSILDLHSETPRFPDGIQPEAVASQVKLHAAKIEELNLKISDLIDDEAEWEAEELHSSAATQEAVSAVAAIDVAMIRLSKMTSPPVGDSAEDAGRDLNTALSHDDTETLISSNGAVSGKLAPAYDKTPRKYSDDRQNVQIYTARLIGPDGRANVSLDACEHALGVDTPNVAPSHVLATIRTFRKRFPVADLSYLGTWKAEAPMILLGMDQSHKLKMAANSEFVIDNIQGHRSKFGWINGGPIPIAVPGLLRVEATSIGCAVVTTRCPNQSTAPAKALEALRTFETPAATLLSAGEKSAVLQFQSTPSYPDTRYTTAIPKRRSISSLLNDHATAAQRLERKLLELKLDPASYARYHVEMVKSVERRYAKEIPAATLLSADEESAVITRSCMIIAWKEGDQRYFTFVWKYPEKNETHPMYLRNLCPRWLRKILLLFRSATMPAASTRAGQQDQRTLM